MSSSTVPTREHLNAPAEKSDWRKDVNELQTWVASQASSLMLSVPPRGRKAFEEIGDKVPMIMGKIRELERLQQERLDHINNSEEMADLTRKIADGKVQLQRQEQEKYRLEQDLTSLSHQRMTARDMLNVDIKAAEQHAQHTLEEDLRLEQRAADLDIQEAALNRAAETLNQNLQTLAEKQEEERIREDDNKKRSIKVNKRLDTLADYRTQRNREFAELNSRYDILKMENASQRESAMEAASLKSDAARLEATIENQKTRLGSLSDIEVRAAQLGSGMVHLTAVVLPEKQAEVASLKAELFEAKKQVSASQKELTGRIHHLSKEVSGLESRNREQNAQISQFKQDKASLQAVANKSTSEADLTKMELKIAQGTIASLSTAWDDNHGLLLRNSELQAAVNNCTSQHSDIHRIREQVSDLQELNNELRHFKVDFDLAKRLQDVSTSRVDDLEQESNGLQQRLNRLGDQVQRDLQDHRTAMAEKDETIQETRQRCDSIGEELDNLKDECNELFARNNRLISELDDLRKQMADLVENRDNLLDTANRTRAELERLNAQLPSSRKRNHDQVDSEEEGASSAGRPERIARRLEKAPESAADGTVIAGDPFIPLDDSVSLQGVGATAQGAPSPAGPSTNSAGQLMNTAAPRALGTANATITPSNGGAFTILIKDVKLLSFSSDVLPNEVLQTLRRKFGAWVRSGFNWATVQSTALGGSCIEARVEKKKSQWNDGPEHACAVCDKRMRLCMVVYSDERVLLLHRKTAENEGRGPEDAKYWVR